MYDDTVSTTEYTAPGGIRYRVRIVPDTAASSPREDDNLTTMHTFDRDYYSPDGGGSVRAGAGRAARHPEPIIPGEYLENYSGRVDMRRASRWVHLFAPDVLAFAGLDRRQDGTLSVSSAPYRWLDWNADGYVAITRDRWNACMGADEDPTAERLAEAIAGDVAGYNTWAEGGYVGYIVERAVTWVRADGIDNEGAHDEDDEMVTWEEGGSCWGFDSEAHALTEATYELPGGSVPTA